MVGEALYRITLSYACYGILVDGDTVKETPPIARWMKGKKISEIRDWVYRKGGVIVTNGGG